MAENRGAPTPQIGDIGETWRKLAKGTEAGHVVSSVVLPPAPIPTAWVNERIRVIELRLHEIGVPRPLWSGWALTPANVQRLIDLNHDHLTTGKFRYPLSNEDDAAFNQWADDRLGAVEPRLDSRAEKAERDRVQTQNDDAHWLISARWIASTMLIERHRDQFGVLGWLLGVCECNAAFDEARRRGERARFRHLGLPEFYDLADATKRRYEADGVRNANRATYDDAEIQKRLGEMESPPDFPAFKQALTRRREKRK